MGLSKDAIEVFKVAADSDGVIRVLKFIGGAHI